MKSKIIILFYLSCLHCGFVFCQNGKMKVNLINNPYLSLLAPSATAKNNNANSYKPTITKPNNSGGGNFVITNGNTCEGESITFTKTFSPTKDWQLTFTYTATGSADGIAVVIHNDSRGTNAVGGSGGSKGYGTANGYCVGDGATSIGPSLDFEFNIYGGNSVVLNYISTQGGNTNSISPGTQPATGINFTNGTPVNVIMRYTASSEILKATLTQGSNTFVYITTGSIASMLNTLFGTNKTYLAFTGGAGALTSTQTVSNVYFFATP